MKTTPWFDMSVEPVRDGVYELYDPSLDVWVYGRFWRGFWRSTRREAYHAAHQKRHSVSVMKGDFSGWRGLAKNPK